MTETVKVWGINGLELELEADWVNPLLTTGAITLEKPVTAEPEPVKPKKGK